MNTSAELNTRLACLQNYALSSGRRMWALVVFNEGPSAVGAGATATYMQINTFV